MHAENNIIIEIISQIKEGLTQTDAIKAAFSFLFTIVDFDSIDRESLGYIFRVKANNYFLQVGFEKNDLYIYRNGQRASYTIQGIPVDGRLFCHVSWSPEELGCIVYDQAWYDTLSSGANKEEVFNERYIVVKTPATYPPNELIKYAREKSIVPIIYYESEADFRHEVLCALQAINDKIKTVDMYNAFWDFTRGGHNKIINRKPKVETDIHPMIHGLLYDIAISKNFEIIPEYDIANGRLDFLIIGILKSYERTYACIEFKHAHSADLIDGLTKQLPAYMKLKGCDYGIYGILYFKGEFFNYPNKSIEEISLEITREKISSGLKNIYTHIYDLSGQLQPSRL